MQKKLAQRGLVWAAGLVLLGAGCTAAPGGNNPEAAPSLAVPAPGVDPSDVVEMKVNVLDNSAEDEAAQMAVEGVEPLPEAEAQEEPSAQADEVAPAELIVEAPAEATVKEFSVSGSSFSFSPSEMRVSIGDRVRVTFKNTGGFHDWSLEGYNVASSRINAGQESVLEFTADKAGRFNFYCSVGSHRELGMEGVLIVE